MIGANESAVPRPSARPTMHRFFRLALLVAAVPTTLHAQRRPREELAPPSALRVDSTVYSRLRWRHVGPEGNRVTSVAGVAGDPNVYYAGAASGGVFKTTDGGIHWAPISDSLPVSSIGSLAVAPSDPNVVWAGTGEPFIRSHISLGWGMFRSTDAGRHWARAGLENTGRISRIVVDPRDPDRAYVAALGRAYGPQPERGIFRTTDGGKTWAKVLFVNDSTGASDLVMDPSNPRVLYAGMWQIEIHSWGRTSGGRGSGLWVTRDGGDTWTRLTAHGLPERPVGKVGLAVSAANPNRVYALIETGDGVPLPNGDSTAAGRLFRSDDRGATWRLVSHDRQIAGRTHYYNRMAVEPDNADEAYFATAAWSKTLDGGQTIIDPPNEEVPGGDHHDIWIDPTNGNRMAVSHDGGVSVTTNRGRSWLIVQLPIAQMYHVTLDNRIPYNLYGNRQDGPSAMCPSNPRLGGYEPYTANLPRSYCQSVGGGESGWATPDTVDTNLVWSSASGFGSVGGIATLYDRRTNVSHSLDIWPRATIGWGADSLRYRFVWTFPLTISPHDHNRVYVGSQHVHVTTDSGRTWREISPDLTRNDKSRQRLSGGLTPDNIGVEYAGVVFAIAESPVQRNLLWAGTNDGLVHVSRDGGASWTNVTRNVPGLLEWGTISSITPSRYDAGTAYLTVDGHQVDNRDPWVYKTTDFGASWRPITAGLAKTPLSYAHHVAEDPAARGLLYLGTEGGMYVSFDDGRMWQPLQTNLPHAPVYWIAVQPRFGDLVVATYGRGFWILDDIAPLRELAGASSAGVTSSAMRLFAPRETYRFRDAETPFAVYYDPTAGQIPPYGASLTYWVKASPAAPTATRATVGRDTVIPTPTPGAPRDTAAARRQAAPAAAAPGDSVTITISDSAGAVVRAMKGPAEAGLNRVWWNLRYDRSKEARIRTSPEYSPWMAVGLEGRPAPGIERLAILAPPGTYTVKLAYRGAEESRPLVVRKDPNSGGSDAEIRAQTELARAIQRDLDSAVTLINRLEVVRGQLAALGTVLAADSARADVRAAADSLGRRLLAAERALFQTRVTGRGQDQIRWPMRLAEQLAYLGQEVGGSDFGPTASQREVAQLLRAELGAAGAAVGRLLQTELVAFNEMLRGRKLENIIAAR